MHGMENGGPVVMGALSHTFAEGVSLGETAWTAELKNFLE